MVEAHLRRHLRTHGFDDVYVERLGALLPARTPTDADIVRVTARLSVAYMALSRLFTRRCPPLARCTNSATPTAFRR
ncbi:MAG: hypothetical protein HC893_02825 [Chloroflexaceae bacterium]|nr:hypothetical protein [Chloroflexaceae bacterium]